MVANARQVMRLRLRLGAGESRPHRPAVMDAGRPCSMGTSRAVLVSRNRQYGVDSSINSSRRLAARGSSQNTGRRSRWISRPRPVAIHRYLYRIGLAVSRVHNCQPLFCVDNTLRNVGRQIIAHRSSSCFVEEDGLDLSGSDFAIQPLSTVKPI